MNVFEKLTIITITYNNEKELVDTINSFNMLLELGTKCIIVNGGKKVTNKLFNKENIKLVEEADFGIYHALNKGQNLVETKYYIKIHSGDKFLPSVETTAKLIEKMERTQLDILLGNQIIDFNSKNRKHTSNLWTPFFFKFGCQPPHMPTIYKRSFIGNLQYDKKNKIIADFFFLEKIFKNNPKWSKSNEFIIYMSGGGKTTSGIKSYFLVSKEFYKNYGFLKGLFVLIFRFPIKLLQTFF